MRAHFTGAMLTPAPTTQGPSAQEVVYTFREQMMLKAAEAIQTALDGGAARMANRTYRMHPHIGDAWHYRFAGDDSMESRLPLPECERQGNNISASPKWQKNGCGRGEERSRGQEGRGRRCRYSPSGTGMRSQRSGGSRSPRGGNHCMQKFSESQVG